MNEYVIIISGNISSWGYSKDYIRYFMNNAKGKPIRVKVTSYGGDVNEAIAISQMFSEHGNVTIEFIGFNASAATWMAFGAKNIEIHDDTFMLVHKCSMSIDIYGSLNSDQIEETIKELEKAKNTADSVNLIIAQKYLARCESKGKTLKDVLTLMSEAKWIDADTIMEWGFADKKLPGSHKKTKLSNEFIEDLKARSLPVPEGVIDSPEPEESENFFKKFWDWLKKSQYTESLNLLTMNKKFIHINQALNVEGFEEQENGVLLSQEQVQKIDEAIEMSENARKSIIDLIDGLSDSIRKLPTMEEKVAEIRRIIDSVPTLTVTNEVHNEKEGEDFTSIAVDPVNKYGISEED